MTVFIYQNFELKNETMVTDLKCVQETGACCVCDPWQYKLFNS